MPVKRFRFGILATVLTAVLVLILLLPESLREWAPGPLRRAAFHFGLDLAGGTQLDFRISEEEIDAQLQSLSEEIALLEKTGGGERLDIARAERLAVEEQRRNLVEAIRTVLERRINALGVSESTITPSIVGPEKHLLVECPGIVDTQKCIETVGKTIQLEFKEEFTEATEEYVAAMRVKAEAARRAVTQSGRTLEVVGQDLGDDLGIAWIPRRVLFLDQLPKGLERVFDLTLGKLELLESVLTVASKDEQGNPKDEDVPGLYLTELIEPRFQTGRVLNAAPTAFAHLMKTEKDMKYVFHEREIIHEKTDPRIAAAMRSMQPGDLKIVPTEDVTRILFLRLFTRGGEQVEASHILVAYKGASGAGPEITRTKEEALAHAKGIHARLLKGVNFRDLATQESSGPSARNGGSLGTFGRGTMMPSFEQVAFSQKAGQISEPVETPFGYHVIRTDSPVSVAPDIAKYDELILSGENQSEHAESTLAALKAGNVRSMEDAVALRTLFFSFKPTGWKDTSLDGKHFRAAAVTLDSITNVPVVQIMFDNEGGKLFQELTKKNVQKRIAIFVGGELVSAPVVQQEITGGTAIITGSNNFDEARRLALDLNTGAIPAPIHLVGQHTIEALLGAEALRTSLEAALIGMVIVMLYMLLIYRLLGVVANIALLVYAALLGALMKVPLFFFSDTYVVLTLAGMAGVILSLGMAVDANVLVFERMKEELRKGKLMKTAVEASFQHAWPAIRDGNVSTLITCAILFLIGSSIVRGFAITLGIGVLLSMFSAITVSRWILRKIALSPLADRKEFFCAKTRS